MNFFMLMRAARFPLMAEEGGGDTLTGGGGGDTTTTTTSTDTTTTAATDVLAEVNASKTVGELEAEQKAKDEAETPEAKLAREAAEAKKNEVPETYEAFKVPEGVEMDEALLAEFAPLAKELGLTQDQAQKLVDLQTKMALGEDTARSEMLNKALEKQRNDWADQVKNDPEIGGAKFDATIATATKAVSTFFGDDFRTLLNESGIGNHPALIKGLHKIGLAISEDKMVLPGTDATVTDDKRAADVMFGDVFKT